MPRRKRLARQRSAVSDHEIEVLRRAIQNGFPWMCWHKDNVFRETRLGIRLNILLTYATGILAGCAVFLSGEIHPDRETVKSLKAELADDIAEAERKYADTFTGKRYKESAFRWGSERTKVDS